ncbi:MAG TPA: nitroreductase, partial [Lactobacillus acetotolerans]|nr:nitroreductase [Lactobacillus acetotolerans]
MTDPILKRVAVRKYTKEQVAKEDVDKLIAAFQAAPC